MAIDHAYMSQLLSQLQTRPMVRPLTFTLDKNDEERIVGQIPINKYDHRFGLGGCEIVVTRLKSGILRLQARCLSFLILKDTLLNSEQRLVIASYLHHACAPMQLSNGLVATTNFFKYTHVNDSIGYYFTHMVDVSDCELDKANLISVIEGLLWINPFMAQGDTWDALQPLILKQEGTPMINTIHVIN